MTKLLKQMVRQSTRAYRRATAWARLMPDFVIIGTQKGGTTHLYALLGTHPDVLMADWKEVHYFDLHYTEGPHGYRSHFPLRLRRHLNPKLRVGEASPYYLFHPLVAERMARDLPQARLMVLLRDPVLRAYSHYHHEVRRKTETLSFEDALAAEPERLAGEAEKLKQDGTYASRAHRSYSYLARGLYADQLAAFQRYFPAERLLVLRSEDLFTQAPEVMAEVSAFLGLSAWAYPTLKPQNTGHYAPMHPDTEARLRAYFAPHNQRLYQQLGRDLGW